MFVSSRAHERVCALLEQSIAQHTRTLELYNALARQYGTLVMRGAVVHEPPPAPLERRAPDRVMEVLADVAGSNAALRRQLLSFVKRRRADGDDDDAIIQALFHWSGDDEGTPE